MIVAALPSSLSSEAAAKYFAAYDAGIGRTRGLSAELVRIAELQQQRD